MLVIVLVLVLDGSGVEHSALTALKPYQRTDAALHFETGSIEDEDEDEHERECEPMIVIDADADPQVLEQFLSLPDLVYRNDGNYCASPRPSVVDGLRRPVFLGRQKILVVQAAGQPVARVVARLSPSLTGGDGRPYGMLGFFEALDRPDAVRPLFAEAVDWLRRAGAGEVIGPIDGDTWHKYRLNAGPHDRPPFLLEPYNPPYYQQLWVAAGFQPLENYYTTLVPDVSAAIPRLLPILKRIERRGFKLEPFRMAEYETELRRLYNLSRTIFAENFLYEEIGWEDFRNLYAGRRALLDPDLIWFARDPAGGDAGFLFNYPDRFAAVAAMRGRRGWLARFNYFLRKGRTQTVNFKTLGVVSEHRKSGLGAALTCRGYQKTLEKGYRSAHLCLIRDGNPSGRMDSGEGELLRRYILYRWGPASIVGGL